MAVLITLTVIFLALCINEIWWRLKKRRSELSRKSIHIVIGVYTSFWPFYLSFTEIKALSIACIVVMVVSKRLNIFKAIHEVDRVSWGEILAVLSIAIMAFLTSSKWLFATSILQMALADGLAALIGLKFGRSNSYKVFGSQKSLIGSLVFFITSLLILVIFQSLGHIGHSLVYLGLTSLVATALENLGVKGLDNLFVPLAVLLMIS
ncbi:MAG TPA: hypothetical protein VFN31_02265 [Candidatus Saccharimonadales bacterium]|nr:hypothetical protein [Candidatus Saccharimonadales bacterium]